MTAGVTPEDCPAASTHGTPFRYCGVCDWRETPAPVPASIGQVVHYTLSEQDAEQINRRRTDSTQNLGKIRAAAIGYQAHIGNEARAGQTYPMWIVRVWGDHPGAAVNGQVILDGNDVLWVTSRTEGDGPGRWAWPPGV